MRHFIAFLFAVFAVTMNLIAAEKYQKVTPRQLMGMRSKLRGKKIEYATYIGPADSVKEQLDKEGNVVGVQAKTVRPSFVIVILDKPDTQKALETFWELPDNSPITVYGELKEFPNGQPYILVEKLELGWQDVKSIPCPRCGGSGRIPVSQREAPPRRRR